MNDETAGKPHKQVRLTFPFDILDPEIEVDEGLAPLLEALWAQGIVTTESCQNMGRGIAYIAFARWEDAERFRKIAPPSVGMFTHARFRTETYESVLDAVRRSRSTASASSRSERR